MFREKDEIMSGGEGTNLNSKQRRVKKGRRHFTRYVHNYTWYTQFQVHSKIKNIRKSLYPDTRTDPKRGIYEPTKNFKPISVLLSVAQNRI